MYYWEEIRKDSLDISLVHLNGKKSLNSNHKLYGLVFYCCHNKLVKCSSVGQSPSIACSSVKTVRSQSTGWFLYLGFHKAKVKVVSRLSSFFKVLGKELLPSSFGLLTTLVSCNCGTEVLILLLLEVTCLSSHAFYMVHLQQ